MDYYNNQTPPPIYGGTRTVTQQVTDVMKKVYVRMFIGLLISGFVAVGVAASPAAMQFIFGHTWVYWGMFIGMIVMAIAIPTAMNKMSSTTIMLLFFLFSALMGASLASIFYVYELGAIARTFFITSGVFGAMSIYGYFTKSNLARIGSFCIMALFGLIIASLVNIFLKSTSLDWIISIVGVLIFVGLTAWDTQQMKQIAAANLAPELTDKLATMGAMNLYLDFINLFLLLLRIFGGNRN